MKSLRVLVVAIVLLTQASPVLATQPGDRAVGFSLRDLKGKKVKLSSFKGKVVLLDFWASWCEPCKAELPALAKMASRFRSDGKDVVIVTINIDKKKANATKFLRTARIRNLTVLLDPGGLVAGQYDLPTMPTSFIIDQRGIVRHVQAGYDKGDEKKYEQRMDALLK